jgi:hypothetical protein
LGIDDWLEGFCGKIRAGLQSDYLSPKGRKNSPCSLLTMLTLSGNCSVKLRIKPGKKMYCPVLGKKVGFTPRVVWSIIAACFTSVLRIVAV